MYAHPYIYKAQGTQHSPSACSCHLPCQRPHHSIFQAARASVPRSPPPSAELSQPAGSPSPQLWGTPPPAPRAALGCKGGAPHPIRGERGGWGAASGATSLFQLPAAEFLGVMLPPDHRPARRQRVPEIRAALPAPRRLPSLLCSTSSRETRRFVLVFRAICSGNISQTRYFPGKRQLCSLCPAAGFPCQLAHATPY